MEVSSTYKQFWIEWSENTLLTYPQPAQNGVMTDLVGGHMSVNVLKNRKRRSVEILWNNALPSNAMNLVAAVFLSAIQGSDDSQHCNSVLEG